MNLKNILKVVSLCVIISTAHTGCDEVLEETPRTILTPEAFSTADGLVRGLTGAYARFRTYYGFQGGAFATVFSDEFMEAQQINNTDLAIYTNMTPETGGPPWGDAYVAISNCNCIIEIGPTATGLTEEERNQLIAEAKFLRAAWYFVLLRHYGGVTLDQGSGPLACNRTPTNSVTRASEEETMAVIIQDLEEAVDALPETRPADRGRIWKASALHLLAKAYLYRGWQQAQYNEGINADILGTYGSDADFTAALETARDLIENQGRYEVALEPNFADIWDEDNAWPSEVLWSIEWNFSQQFNPGIGDAGSVNGNLNNFFFREFYVQDVPGVVRDVQNGRPWIRFSPTAWMIDVAFADKENDERYDGSFQTVWYANDAASIPVWSEADAQAGYVDASLVGQPKFNVGDTAQFHADLDFQNSFASEQERNDWVNSRGYVVWFPTASSPTSLENAPRNLQNKHFPSLSKFDRVARPADFADDPNIASTRPFYVHRLAETYLVAAEAAIMLGDRATAVQYINVIRDRANAEQISESDLVGVHGDEIDFILDERTRELAGERLRWFDLKRTRRLLSRVHYQGDGFPAVYNRQFNGGAPAPGYPFPEPRDFHYRRPIPQGTIDAVVGDYPQNTGYN
ncbi:MAG: RagB/SusD family nutrient uptake outer membrane protein [Cyclobacteriaceae bacterium]